MNLLRYALFSSYPDVNGRHAEARAAAPKVQRLDHISHLVRTTVRVAGHLIGFASGELINQSMAWNGRRPR
jgi:hypothetical protein